MKILTTVEENSRYNKENYVIIKKTKKLII